jgi:hypothetical protein
MRAVWVAKFLKKIAVNESCMGEESCIVVVKISEILYVLNMKNTGVNFSENVYRGR